MSKKGYISRYMLIIQKLRSKPYCTFDEISDYVYNKLEFLQVHDDTLDIGFSKRTLQRDIKDIRNIFGIDIEYSRAKKGYYISNDEYDNISFQRRIEAFDMFNSLNLAEELNRFIHLENRRPQGTENLHGLIHAIKNKMQVKFLYQKFRDEKKKQRTVEPYALKEFKNRWYVIAKDLNDDHIIKCFGLDRLSCLDITNRTFEYPMDFDVEEMFRYSFGIITPNDTKPSEIILSFAPLQGKYIKSLPLHETQQVIKDNDEELRVSLKIYITYDFIMEVLSHGEMVKVIKPGSLQQELKKTYQKALENYQ